MRVAPRVLAAVMASVVACGVVATGAPVASAARSSPPSIGPVLPSGAVIERAVTPSGRHSTGTIVLGGTVVRSYALYVPRSLPEHAPVPLLVALHGGLGSGPQFEQNSGFDGLAEANRFIVVYPNGTPINRFTPNRLVWNGGGAARSPSRARTTWTTLRSSRP